MSEVFAEIKVKPLSVNRVWQGRRFKTKDYQYYERLVLSLLPDNLEIPEGLLEVYYEFGLSSTASDWDNPVKPFQDVLQKKYNFNDSRIMRAHVSKYKVDKGNEYISFVISQFVADQSGTNRKGTCYSGVAVCGCVCSIRANDRVSCSHGNPFTFSEVRQEDGAGSVPQGA